MKRVLVWSCLLSCLLLTGCAVRILYNWLDWAISWKMDDYFTLTSDQSRLLKKQVNQILYWHRKAELPQYVVALRKLSFDLRRPLTEKEVDEHLTTFENLFRELAEGMKQPANRFAATLTDEQVQRFMADRLKRQQDDKDEYAADQGASVYRSYQRKVEKNMESWLGAVEPAQRPLIDEFSGWQQKYYKSWLDYQDIWLKELAHTLAVRGTPAFEPGLVAVFLKGNQLGDGRFQQYVADSREQTVQWFTKLSASLSDKQRLYVRKQLSELASDLESLTR